MPTDGLIVIAKIKPGYESRPCAALNRIGNDIKGKRLAAGEPEPHIDFPSSRSIHFARMAILDDPDRRPGCQRLLLATDYDGTRREHVLELAGLTTEPDAIWGCCEGYGGRAYFRKFIHDHLVEPQAYYVAFSDLTVERIRSLLSGRAEVTAPPSGPLPSSLTATGTVILHDLLRFPRAGLAVPGMLLRRGPLTTLLAARRVNATLDRIWWVWWFNRLTFNSFPAPATLPTIPPGRRGASTWCLGFPMPTICAKRSSCSNKSSQLIRASWQTRRRPSPSASWPPAAATSLCEDCLQLSCKTAALVMTVLNCAVLALFDYPYLTDCRQAMCRFALTQNRHPHCSAIQSDS